MTAKIVNTPRDLGAGTAVTPLPYGYLLIGAMVAPPSGPPFVRNDDRRSAVLTRLADHLRGVARLEPVVRATGYRAVLITPGRPPRFKPDLRPPRFDVVALVETNAPESLRDVGSSAPVEALRNVLHDSASRVKEIEARCIRAIGDVDKTPEGTYLFNFWAAADLDTALEVFDHLAPWFQAKTGLRNSTVLQPTNDDEFAFVNHARWDTNLVSIAANQFLRPSFYSFVRRNLGENQVEVYPSLYRRI
jgi:hypothetical protein